ncbi:MAG: sugar phosphate isomerase/epimerase [Spirochaetales bacterium]|jgi:sugar phosphate isomerase/epimerase|nr:sugar phosphate isomerase/epimerase [Spirochaetales bacterium]
MNLGVVTRSFPELDNVQTAALLKAEGFSSTELCFSQSDSKYWAYNGRSDLSDMTDERSMEIVESYRSEGIFIAALGVFTNLLDPDESERGANLGYFERMMQIASYNGIPAVSTECGFMPGNRGINSDEYELRFDRLKDSFAKLCAIGDRYSVDIALEPCVIDVVPSAKRTADFIEQMGSPRVKVLLDPANLIANSSEEDMFHYLSDHVAYFHGKDRKVNDAKGRVVGDGDINWPLFLSLYHEHSEGTPIIFEYVTSDNFREIRDRLLAFDAEKV